MRREPPSRLTKKGPIWLAVGAATALFAWWPAVGAIEGLFWGRTFDAKGPDDLAIDTMLAAHPDLQYGVRGWRRSIPPAGDRDCLSEIEFRQAKNMESDFGEQMSWLDTALYHERNARDDNRAYRIAAASLRSLPEPALGALWGCIRGSVLGGLCDAYLVRRVTAARESSQRNRQAELANDEINAQKAACLAVDGVAQGLPTTNHRSSVK